MDLSWLILHLLSLLCHMMHSKASLLKGPVLRTYYWEDTMRNKAKCMAVFEPTTFWLPAVLSTTVLQNIIFLKLKSFKVTHSKRRRCQSRRMRREHEPVDLRHGPVPSALPVGLNRVRCDREVEPAPGARVGGGQRRRRESRRRHRRPETEKVSGKCSGKNFESNHGTWD